MKEHVLDDVLARRFLLGELSQEEQGQVEEQAFLNRDSFAFLQAAEDDLIDEFLYDDLSSDEKERFQKYFLSQPGRRENLRIAQALQKYLNQPAPSPAVGRDVGDSREGFSLREWLNIRSTPFRLSLATALLAIAAATGIWFAIRILRQPGKPPPTQAHEQGPAEAPTPAHKGSETPTAPTNSPAQNDNQRRPPLSDGQPPAPVYSFVLIPGGPIRGEGSVTSLQFPSASGIARLELPLIEDSSYRSYQATLQTDEGKAIRRWTKLEPKILESGKGVLISLPVSLLERQKRYRVVLRGISSDGKARDIGNYYFQVNK